MKWSNKITCAVLVWFFSFAGVCQSAPHSTALEQSQYTRLTSSSEISSFLGELSSKYDFVKKITIATSVRGNPVDALLVSSDLERFKERNPDDNKLTVMLVGSQHGMEPSGAEALLMVARDVIEGKLHSHLAHMNFVFIPNSNPDGRNSNRRVNGNGVNLSTNFVLLSEPESKGIVNALHRWQPAVVLDVHESAVLKKKTLAKQGYLTDFEAQFEAANNPNVDAGIRRFSFDKLLPDIIQRVSKQRLPARRYIGEITSIHQPITHGGLSLRNLRNMAGMLGVFSFLLENKLDPSTGTYPTPRNIRVRVSKQYLCITTFLECCRDNRSEIIALSRNARIRWKNLRDKEPLFLDFSYVADPNQPQIALPLRKIDTGAVIQHVFNYHGAISCHRPRDIPKAYLVTDHQAFIGDILERHHITWETLSGRDRQLFEIQHVLNQRDTGAVPERGCPKYSVKERREEYTPNKGDIMVRLKQPARRLIPLLLGLRSSSGFFTHPPYCQMNKIDQDFFIYSIPAGSPD